MVHASVKRRLIRIHTDIKLLCPSSLDLELMVHLTSLTPNDDVDKNTYPETECLYSFSRILERVQQQSQPTTTIQLTSHTINMPEQHHKSAEHVAAGYKATIHNASTSEEAKKHAWEELHKMGIYEIDDSPSDPVQKRTRSRSPAKRKPSPKHVAFDLTSGFSTDAATTETKNEGNVIGGYKAALKNPRVSDEAKEHAEEELREHGVDI
ncbi:hypothetical protein NP233_g7752 [Leucocoprinus birnbaumii]|uniref:Uncharacterized protein n=1 Tax=Leucocoprinus birnbaumii TaxID=56174 RepID=A0AAD5VNK7_9AGAR|nr:hypothetical protein NP233_g7752 [Leucocoprinus birnbaumii]